jgi:superfamily II DNA or RNA helicase
MPRIFDNVELKLSDALNDTLAISERSDFCVGYFNLRGWRKLDEHIDKWSGGEGHCCRLLVGMQRLPDEECRMAFSMTNEEQWASRPPQAGGTPAVHRQSIDNATALRLKKTLAADFRVQLALGMPTNEDEAGLRRLAAQIRARKVIVKLFLRYPLHAKLYLLFRPDPNNPTTAFLGSSNLTMAGLWCQGELNVDVLDHDACTKLARWFEERWTDKFCIDISEELAQIIEESWARLEPVSPYHIYLKIAYHLAHEARSGLNEFDIPADLAGKLFDFQAAAVKIACQHLNKRKGVVIGDVVGLGKTLMATAVARVFEDDHGLDTLIVCPKNLVGMWEDYRLNYHLHAKVISITRVSQELPDLRRYRQVIIDESHNLRNREGQRYRVLHEYLHKNESQVILLSATPYNKTYLDLANQLRLFIPDDKNLGVRPERYLRAIGETEFIRRHQCQPNTLPGFEKSESADDWRELMRLHLVRRTRTFIKANYALTDCTCGHPVKGSPAKCPRCRRPLLPKARKYLLYQDGRRSYFPERLPKRAVFQIDEKNPKDQYARLYSPAVVGAIETLQLPRYGLGNYVLPAKTEPRTAAEEKQVEALSRAGKRLMGFCRTNLFKRLESSGIAFLQSLERHVLRNFVYLHAIQNGLDLPLGAQDSAILDVRVSDEDAEGAGGAQDDEPNGRAASAENLLDEAAIQGPRPSRPHEAGRMPALQARAAQIYETYAGPHRSRFKWIRPTLFVDDLAEDLRADAHLILELLTRYGDWNPENDTKLTSLEALLKKHPKEKVLVFSQFADTVRYLEEQLKGRGLQALEGVTGDTEDPTKAAHRFSPVSNEKSIAPEDQLRVLIATDVLSEGQNLQDAHIVVNFDLPWAIIRLVQRAGRVDRIGQEAKEILCYSFLPTDGVERIINLRNRVRQRLRQNQEVVGADEAFFDDDRNDATIHDLFTEKAGALDGEEDTEVDLSSYAYQIWRNAVDKDPSLAKTIPELPNVVYSTKAHRASDFAPHGAIVYAETPDENDALLWVDREHRVVSESPVEILRAAECAPETPALPRQENHHALVATAVKHVMETGKSVGGQLGRPSGARFRTYERLKAFAEQVQGTLFDREDLHKAIDEIYRFPLRPLAVDILNRQFRLGITNENLAELVIDLRSDGRLCQVQQEEASREPRIICSLGLTGKEGRK